MEMMEKTLGELGVMTLVLTRHGDGVWLVSVGLVAGGWSDTVRDADLPAALVAAVENARGKLEAAREEAAREAAAVRSIDECSVSSNEVTGYYGDE